MRMNDFNSKIITDFRTGTGPMVGPFPRAALVILHSTGAVSGEARESPLMSFPDGSNGRYIVASKAGAPTNPAWYHNLVANPEVSIEVANASGTGTSTVPVTATVLAPDDRHRVYADIAAQVPTFADYEKSAGDRVIPVVHLTPR